MECLQVSLSWGSNPSSFSSSFKLEITNLCTTTIVPLTALLYRFLFIKICIYITGVITKVYSPWGDQGPHGHRENIFSDNRNCLCSAQSFLNLFKFKSVATNLLMPMAPDPSARKVPAVTMHQKSEGRKKP